MRTILPLFLILVVAPNSKMAIGTDFTGLRKSDQIEDRRTGIRAVPCTNKKNCVEGWVDPSQCVTGTAEYNTGKCISDPDGRPTLQCFVYAARCDLWRRDPSRRRSYNNESLFSESISDRAAGSHEIEDTPPEARHHEDGNPSAGDSFSK